MQVQEDRGTFWREVAGEWRQQWRPGLAATVGGALCFSLWPNVSSLFVQPLQDQFGWSRTEIVSFHNYDRGLAVCIGTFVAAAACYLGMGSYPAPYPGMAGGHHPR